MQQNEQINEKKTANDKMSFHETIVCGAVVHIEES